MKLDRTCEAAFAARIAATFCSLGVAAFCFPLTLVKDIELSLSASSSTETVLFCARGGRDEGIVGCRMTVSVDHVFYY